MSRKKIILLAIALITAGIGVALAIWLPGDHAQRPSNGSHVAIYAGLIPVYVAVFASRRRHGGCGKEKKNG